MESKMKILHTDTCTVASPLGRKGGIKLAHQTSWNGDPERPLFATRFVVYPYDNRDGVKREVEHARMEHYRGFPSLKMLRVWVLGQGTVISTAFQMSGRVRTINQHLWRLAGRLEELQENWETFLREKGEAA